MVPKIITLQKKKKFTLQINSNKSLARFHSSQMPVMLIKHLKNGRLWQRSLAILVLTVILSCSIIILIFRRITHHNNHVVKVRHNMHFMPNTLCTNNTEENNNQSYHLKLLSFLINVIFCHKIFCH